MNQMDGGYTEYRKVTDEDLEIFNSVVGTLDGVGYSTPKEVATQVVAGINYRFKTVQSVVRPDAKGQRGIVEIYKSLAGKAEFKGFIPEND